MIDFRYHLASLMAVFLALGIGMLIGNSFVGLASVESQNRALKQLQANVSELRVQYRASHQEIATLKGQLNDRDRAIRTLAPRVVDGLLTDRRVALILLGNPKRSEIATELASVLTAAGAEVASTTLIQRNWLPENPEIRARIRRLLLVPPGENETEAAHRTLAKAIVTGNWNTAVHRLAEATPGLVLDGAYDASVGSVVIVDNTENAEEALEAQSERSMETAILEALQNSGVRVVAAEPEATSVSLISFYNNRGVATVDNIDTAVGQVACAMALAAGSGSYGTKPTADRLLPEVAATPSPDPAAL
ncbi:MAG: copper transporter [Armatimonadetes bacterium]|nr:copper transporter [Armatimonadota bacterium]